jgi:peptide/nickel transport system substrate-binding protein
MKNFRWQLLIILLTGIIVGVLLITQQPDSPINSAQPQTGGVYTEGLVGSFQRLNPLFDHYNQPDRDVNRLIFNGLVKFDLQGVAQPDLAESWGYSKDGLTYNFSIKENITWQDGSPFTVDDIIFTIDKMRDPDSVIPTDLKNFWSDIKLNRLNEFNIQFILPEPFSPFLDYLTFGILPEHILGKNSFKEIQESLFNLQPVGTGPYKLDHLIVENDKITGVVLSANQSYFGEKPFIDQVIFKYFDNSSDMYTAYNEGEIQGISRVSNEILPEVLRNPDLATYTGRRPELAMVILNLNDTKVDFFQDVNVRQALMKSINRSVIINQFLGGQAIEADSPIFPGTWAYYNNAPIAFDPEAAINHLKTAEFVFAGDTDTIRSKAEKKLSFSMIYPDDDIHKNIAEQIQKDWKNIGVEVKIEPLPYETIIDDRLVNRNYQAALVDFNLSKYPDPDPYPFWDQAQATGGQNYSQWDNRIASEYIEQARVTTDLAERIRLYHNFQVVFREEMPALLLYYPVYTYAVSTEVKGVQMGSFFDPSDRLENINTWFLLVKRGNQSELTPTVGN